MSNIWKLLEAVGRVPAEAWDAVFPQGPDLAAIEAVTRQQVSVRRWRGEDVLLNPQPLPPHEAAVGAVLVGRLLTSAIIVVGGRDESPARRFLSDIADWCGTGWPRTWPRPKGTDWDDDLMFTGAALHAAHLAAHYDHNHDLQEALGQAVEQLLNQVNDRARI